MKTTIALLLAAAFALPHADPPPFPLGWKSVPAPEGMLGYRIGTYLTIEGVRDDSGKTGQRTLAVDTINGFTLPAPVSIWVENVVLPKGERCTLKGYETGRWIGVPDEVVKVGAKDVQQAAWQFRFTFIATSAEKPAGLELK